MFIIFISDCARDFPCTKMGLDVLGEGGVEGDVVVLARLVLVVHM